MEGKPWRRTEAPSRTGRSVSPAAAGWSMGRHRCSNRTTARAQDEAAGSAGAGERRHAGWAWESLYVLWRGALLILAVSLWIKKSKEQHIVTLNTEPRKLSWADLLLIGMILLPKLLRACFLCLRCVYYLVQQSSMVPRFLFKVV